MSRMALRCPECGEPMRFGFRKVCRRCGAKLVMVPRLFHLSHVRVFVAGPRAALTALVRAGKLRAETRLFFLPAVTAPAYAGAAAATATICAAAEARFARPGLVHFDVAAL